MTQALLGLALLFPLVLGSLPAIGISLCFVHLAVRWKNEQHAITGRKP